MSPGSWRLPCSEKRDRSASTPDATRFFPPMTTEYVQGSPEGRERRRAVRRPIDGHMAIVPVVLPVQVIDISTSGVLLSADCPIHPGRGGMLCLDMNGEPFRGEIQVKRIASAASRPDSYEMGASFLSLSPEYRHILRRITQ